MAYRVIREDIIHIKCDVIVNTANPKPVIGTGTEEAIYLAAGKEKLLQARKEIGDLPIGSLGCTPGFELNSKYIFHVSSPMYIDGKHNEENQLKECYLLCLNKAVELNVKSIAFPLLGTGNYHFTKSKGMQIALSAFQSFLCEHDLEIILVIYDAKSYELSKKLFNDIESFINDEYIEYKQSVLKVTSVRGNHNRIKPREYYDEVVAEYSSIPTLDDFLQPEKTFSDRLFEIIQEKGLKDSEVYHEADVSRQVFSKIRSNSHYVPNKKTAFRLCIALKLSYDESVDLIRRANLTFSPSDRFDLVVKYYIIHGIYDLNAINQSLYDRNLELLNTY